MHSFGVIVLVFFFPNTLLAQSWNFLGSFLSSFICTLCGYVFFPCGMLCKFCIRMIHLRNNGRGGSATQPLYWCMRRRKNCWFWMWIDYSWIFTTNRRLYLINLIMWSSTTFIVTFCCSCSSPLWLFFFSFFVERFVCLVCL